MLVELSAASKVWLYAIAENLRQICKDVTIEPHLIPIEAEAEQFQQKGNNADKARLDQVNKVFFFR